ncbi:MAG: hypothetical protein AAFA34_01175 [Thermoplasmata archaeon]
MTRYDLREYRKALWFRLRAWFRLGFSVFVAVLLSSTIIGVYQQVSAGKFGLTQAIGDGLVLFILALFTFIVLFMPPPAVEMVVDEVGVHLIFDCLAPDVRPWGSARTRIRGRFTSGANDSISRGQPVWSIYGPLGGVSEPFVPYPAFQELLSAAKAHGFVMTETSGHSGWTLFTLAPGTR